MSEKKVVLLSFLGVLGLTFSVPQGLGQGFFDNVDRVSSRTIDMNNQRDAVSVFHQFNITLDDIVRKKHNIKWMASTPETWTERYEEKNIKKTLRQQQIMEKVTSLRNESQPTSIRNTKLYPICTTANNEYSWYGDYNQTLSFWESSLILKIHENPIKSAFLKLYKIRVNDSADVPFNICNRNYYYRQIRLTVSVHNVQIQSDSKKQKERKKIICSTKMIPYVYEGWIEMEVERAIYIWKTTNNTNNNFRIFLEVHDEENFPLKPGNFFMPSKCLARSGSNYKRHNPLKEILDEDEDGQHLYIKIEHEEDCSGSRD